MTDLIEFTRGVPPPESFPAERLAECAKTVLSSNPAGVLQYANARGYLPLREWIAEQHQVHADRVILGQGSLQILDHLIRILVKPGDVVLVEKPSYDRVLTIIHRAGGVPVGIPIVEGGIDLNALELVLRDGLTPAFFYIIPDFQNPSGSCMTAEKRFQLVELAARYKLTIVEDSPYRALRYAGEEVESLFSLSPGSVIRMSSFSKLIAPGLRVGYMVAPQELQDRLVTFAEETYINASYLNQAIVMEFIQRKWLDEQMILIKELYRNRLTALLNSLQNTFQERAAWTKPQGGFFVGLTLDDGNNLERLKLAGQYGLKLTDGRGFFTEGGESFIRLPFCALSPQQLTTGIERLSRLLKGEN